MGYFNALTECCFKTAQDGRKLFFPWGTLGRGYIIETQQDYERLERQVRLYMSLVLPSAIGASGLFTYFGLFTVTLLVAFWAIGTSIWLHRAKRGLQPSKERLSLQENMTTQALALGAGGVWLLLVMALAFVVGGIFLLTIDPRKWLIALATIIFSGVGAAFFAAMLVLRRGSGSGSV
jgi:hypothetical protein